MLALVVAQLPLFQRIHDFQLLEWGGSSCSRSAVRTLLVASRPALESAQLFVFYYLIVYFYFRLYISQ